jgi:uncharacterized protein YgiM (DUF1202 family)
LSIRYLIFVLIIVTELSYAVIGQNPEWPSGATDYFTLNPSCATGENVYRIAVIGDSVAWGNGLERSETYYYKVAETIRDQLQMPVEITVFAHSGAVISNPDICLPPPCPPTLTDQAKYIKNDVNLILVSGGINDVGIYNILDPSTPADTISSLSKSKIETPMADLLADLIEKTDAKIMVTGYYPIITDESKLDSSDRGIDYILSMASEKSREGVAMTATVSAATPVGGILSGGIGYMKKNADIIADMLTQNSKLSLNSYTFYFTSSDSLRSAVKRADNLENRVVFVDPLFNNANSYHASDTLLSDSIIDRSIAHPTSKGAELYADRIKSKIRTSGGSDWLLETIPAVQQAGTQTADPQPTASLNAFSEGTSQSNSPKTVTSISQSTSTPKFSIDSRVETTGDLNVRSGPGLSYAAVSPTKPAGTTGKISDGSVFADGFTWWKIQYDDGTTGWSQDKRLKKETTNQPLADQSSAFGAIPVGTSQMERDKSNTKETLLIPTLYPITSPPPDESNAKESIADQMEVKNFDRGNKVETTNSLNVRDAPGISSSTVIGTKVAGSAGTILEGPIYADDFTWWKIQYDDGTTGWSQDKRLERETANHPIADQSSAFGAIPVGTSQGLPTDDQTIGSAEAWNEEANSLCSLGKYDEAIKCLNRAIELDPTNPQFWNNKSVIFCIQGNYEEAMQCLDKVIFIDPHFSAALNSKGEILMKMGRYSEAIKYFNRAIKINPESEPALTNKEAAQKALGIGKKTNEGKQLSSTENNRVMEEDIEAYIEANFDNIFG